MPHSILILLIQSMLLLLFCSLNNAFSHRRKLQFLGKFQEYRTGTTFEPSRIRKKSDNDDGEKLDIMKSQATELQYYRMHSQNKWWMMRLKAIEAEYYFIENY